MLQAPHVLFEIHQLNNTHVLPWHNFKCVLCFNVQFKAMNAMCWMLSNGFGTNFEPKLVTMQKKGLKLTHLTNGTYKFHKTYNCWFKNWQFTKLNLALGSICFENIPYTSNWRAYISQNIINTNLMIILKTKN